MALLHIFAALRPSLSCSFVAAYIDHGLRPLETPAEKDCVHEAASRLGMEYDTLAVDVARRAMEGGLSLEQAARELRYQAFDVLADRWKTKCLAVAHTADDQAEELLLRLVRGGGRKALSGMRIRSANILRPLLATPKKLLLTYLAEHHIGFCHDSSNDDRRFLRNRIRHDLLPLLESDYDPGIRRALLKTAASLSEDEDLLASLLQASWDEVVECSNPGDAIDASAARYLVRRKPFLALHSALQRRLVEELLWTMGAAARYEQIMAVVHAIRSGRSGSELHLSRGLRVQVARESLLFSYPRGKGSWRGRLSSP